MAKTTAPAPRETRRDEPAAEYTVVARRYRPQQFADLIGQEPVARALTNALTSDRVAHAYLFTGARGVGKTSCARILAKALNCVTGPTATPCDRCDVCLSVAAGDDVDVLEIDGASNNKVDEIRDLRSNVGFRPQRARYKIYIIDEVHMLSNSAFNALLKTLEEPPPHVKFIFATTEVQKIPVTILSRCQRFDFAAIGPAKVFETLRHIVAKEGLKADDEALQIVARRAGGSMRDAQTLLDQLLGYADGPLTAATVHALLGTAGDARVADLAAAILGRDAKTAVACVTEAAARGLQLGELLDQLVDYWRGLMLVHVAGNDARDLPGTPALHERIRGHAKQTSLDTVLAGLDVLTATKTKLRGGHVQVLFEVAVVRLARMDELVSVAHLAQMIAASPAVEIGPSRVAVQAANAGNRLPEPSKKNLSESSRFESQSRDVPKAEAQQQFADVWENVLKEIGPMRKMQLSKAKLPAIIGPNLLSITFPKEYSASYDFCNSEPVLDAIRVALKRLTRADWIARVELATETNPPAAGDAPRPATAAGERGERTKDLQQLPIFRRAIDVLGAQLVRVDDGFHPGPAATAGPDLTSTRPTGGPDSNEG